jgi:hypothetical protein
MSTETQDQMAACAEMSKPADQHKSLARFAGKWRAEVSHWMDPTAEPMKSTGVMTNTMVLGDRFLQEEYEDDAGMFSGKGFWGYNTVAARYEGFWVDSMGTFFQIEHGQHDVSKDAYTMTGEMLNPMTKQPMKKRSVITFKNKDEHQMEMFFGGGDIPEMRAMLIKYTRA